MKEHLGLLTFFSVVGLSGLISWSALSRPVDSRMSEEAVTRADFLPPVEVPGASMRDALTSSPMPVPIAGYSMAPKPRAEAALPRLPRGVEQKARRSPALRSLLAKPASFLVRRTALGRPKELRRFLSDEKAVNAYLDSALVRAALRHGSVAKAVLGNGAVVRAFLASPALRDPAAARALIASPMVRKMLDCPGVQEALSDPAVMTRLAADPDTLEFVAENPQALRVLSQALPALAQALGA